MGKCQVLHSVGHMPHYHTISLISVRWGERRLHVSVALKRTRFESVDTVKENVMGLLDNITGKDLQHCFWQCKILMEQSKVEGSTMKGTFLLCVMAKTGAVCAKECLKRKMNEPGTAEVHHQKDRERKKAEQ
ncbi:uncharacterized protein LOC124596500 [Schistocerca americana]|uniref:uncharacterized protein LOC124596500 n=1 Tax=Schistocerca americana TaxID=7009 RepID=UPI001F501E37|nr:uncharacterized protein LOC124596500 [Schistocerca americana]